MKSIVSCALFVLLGVAAAAATDEWSGMLVDADCTHHNGGLQACEPGLNTTAFGLVVAGKAYLFNKSGNQKASEAIKQRAAILAADPTYPHASPTSASVMGVRAGNTIIVKRLDLQ